MTRLKLIALVCVVVVVDGCMSLTSAQGAACSTDSVTASTSAWGALSGAGIGAGQSQDHSQADCADLTSPPGKVALADRYEHGFTPMCSTEPPATLVPSTCQQAYRYCNSTGDPRDRGSMAVWPWRRLKAPPGSPWEQVGVPVCDKAPSAGAAVPSLGDIQRAFRALPFSTPTVSIQPVGNVTLVNLPTFYRATWPDDQGLRPGEISRPVQLLTWSVQFRVTARTYDFHFGDGTSTGPVTDAGGVYPDGAIRHTYTHPIPTADVRVDATLTGQFRANGGQWVDIDTVADIQDEPVTTLHVKQAHARLVAR